MHGFKASAITWTALVKASAAEASAASAETFSALPATWLVVVV